ncbi:MAG: VWA domain-containing protein [Gammaproteobacteria bacterium]|nr:VWA domain-containing protein [Gammaproteobacteria bacterium]
MTTRTRRPIEEISMSFLDVICCGFGAVILLLMITKTAEPVILEKTTARLDGFLAARDESVHELRGQTTTLTRELSEKQKELDLELETIARLNRELTTVLARYDSTQSQAEDQLTVESKLTTAKQSLTEEMERLLGSSFTRSDDTIGGIPVDSEYIIFVIDTSGSMFNFAWGLAMQKMSETLAIYPTVKGIQVMDDQGGYMFSRYAGRWIPDSPARRKAILERMRSWNPFSNSSPVEGIERAVRTFYDPDKRVSIYVFGDDFTGNSIEEVVDTVDRINTADASGERRMRIHAVGFPVLASVAERRASFHRFAALMRELTHRNNGTFVGLPDFQ